MDVFHNQHLPPPSYLEKPRMRNHTRLFDIWHLGGWMRATDCGSTKLTGSILNSQAAGLVEVKYTDVFHNQHLPPPSYSEETAKTKVLAVFLYTPLEVVRTTDRGSTNLSGT